MKEIFDEKKLYTPANAMELDGHGSSWCYFGNDIDEIKGLIEIEACPSPLDGIDDDFDKDDWETAFPFARTVKMCGGENYFKKYRYCYVVKLIEHGGIPCWYDDEQD